MKIELNDEIELSNEIELNDEMHKIEKKGGTNAGGRQDTGMTLEEYR